MLTVKACFETALFTRVSLEVFQSLQFRKYISYDHNIWFQNFWKLIYIPEMEEEVDKKFFVFRIIAFELGVANSHNLQQDTCHPETMC